MKTALIAYTGFMSSILLVVIISVITMKSSYYELIRQSLDDSLEYSISMLQAGRELDANTSKGDNGVIAGTNEDGTDKEAGGSREITWDADDTWGTELVKPSDKSSAEYKEYADNKLKQDFVKYLASTIDSKVDKIKVDIYGADAEYGLLSVRITAEFTYPFNKKDSVEVYKTIILDKVLR